MNVYVVINNLDFKIKSNSIVAAVDYCFKSFFALNIEFSSECKHLWTFLQMYLYRIELKSVKPYNVVNKLINEIDNKLKENSNLSNTMDVDV